MIRLITIITMVLIPIISVSTTTNDQESIVRSRDLCDRHCTAGPPDGEGDPFSNGGFETMVAGRSD